MYWFNSTFFNELLKGIELHNYVNENKIHYILNMTNNCTYNIIFNISCMWYKNSVKRSLIYLSILLLKKIYEKVVKADVNTLKSLYDNHCYCEVKPNSLFVHVPENCHLVSFFVFFFLLSFFPCTFTCFIH